jgi:hypothetical protein
MVNVHAARLKTVLSNEKRTKKRPCDNKAFFVRGFRPLAYFD